MPLPAFHPLEIRGSVDRPSNPRDTQTRARSTPNGPLRSVHLSRTRHGRGPLRARFHPRRRERGGAGTILRPTGSDLSSRPFVAGAILRERANARESATTMALFDSTRTLGVPGGSFHGDASMSASMYGRGGSTCGVDRNALDEISSDISSANIATCTGRIAQYQVRSRLRSRIDSPRDPVGTLRVRVGHLQVHHGRVATSRLVSISCVDRRALTKILPPPLPPSAAANGDRQRQVQHGLERTVHAHG